MHVFMGGSFDPVHEGHLRTADGVRQHLHAARVYLVPAACSPLKDRSSTPDHHRLAMLQLAVQDYPSLAIDDRELRRPAPSFTVDTLRELRRELGESESIVWVMGVDALANLAQWKEWQTLSSLAHLLVVERPDAQWPEFGPVADWLTGFALSGTPEAEPDQLQCRPSGQLARVRLAPVPVSSTGLRTKLAARTANTSRPDGLPDSVWHYITKHSLYQV